MREAVRQRYALWLFAWVRLATAAFCWLCCPEKEGAARRGRGAAGRCGACAGGAAGVWAPLIYIEWGCGKLSKINNAGEQPVGADAEHPELEPVQLRAQGGEGRVRARAAGDEGDVVGELLRDKVPVEEEDDQGPAAEEEPGAVDKHDGCAGAPEHREAVQDVRGYMAVDLEGDWYFLVMEYCDMGNLYSMQSKLTNKVFSFEEALNIFNQVLRGVEVIHRNKIVHRDLKL